MIRHKPRRKGDHDNNNNRNHHDNNNNHRGARMVMIRRATSHKKKKNVVVLWLLLIATVLVLYYSSARITKPFWVFQTSYYDNHDVVLSTPSSSSSSSSTTMTTTSTTTTGCYYDLPTTTEQKQQEKQQQEQETILLIQQGDKHGGFGTIFFLFLLNQLLYADMHHLKPWIHMNSFSQNVYDRTVHYHGDNNNTTTLYYQPSLEVSMEQLYDPFLNRSFPYPGKPVASNHNNPQQQPQPMSIHGTGVWNSYFYPVSGFDPHLYTITNPDSSSSATTPCRSPPIITTMSVQQIIPNLHIFAPYALRAWKYGGLPPVLHNFLSQPSENNNHNNTTPNHTTTATSSIEEWLQPMRQKGHRLVSKYFKPLPYVQDLVQQTWDNNRSSLLHYFYDNHTSEYHNNGTATTTTTTTKTTTTSNTTSSKTTTTTTTTTTRTTISRTTTTAADNNNHTANNPKHHAIINNNNNKKNHHCLAVHIRHSDKGNKRKRIPVSKFLPYLLAYYRAGGRYVYLATDSSRALRQIQTLYPRFLQSIIHIQQHLPLSSRDDGGVGGGEGAGEAVGTTRSDNATALFHLTTQKHRLNLEILVDILAMSKCTFFVHGLSAVSEAVHYYNYPVLHNDARGKYNHYNINLDDRDHNKNSKNEHLLQPKEFETLVATVLSSSSANNTNTNTH